MAEDLRAAVLAEVEEVIARECDIEMAQGDPEVACRILERVRALRRPDDAPTADDDDDDDEYPSGQELQALRRFEGTARHFVDEVLRLWSYPDYATVSTITDDFDREVLQLRLATGGWSGNESVVQAIDAGMFRVLWWHLSQRGGLHIYRVPVRMLDEPFKFGLGPAPVATC